MKELETLLDNFSVLAYRTSEDVHDLSEVVSRHVPTGSKILLVGSYFNLPPLKLDEYKVTTTKLSEMLFLVKYESFDAVILLNSFELCNDRLLRQMFKLLRFAVKPKGILITLDYIQLLARPEKICRLLLDNGYEPISANNSTYSYASKLGVRTVDSWVTISKSKPASRNWFWFLTIPLIGALLWILTR